MKLDKVEYPFSNFYTHAYIIINSEKRRMVCLYDARSGIRRTTAYARYLLSVKLGRFLLPTEQVDHIDNDKTNDSLDNLQILSPKENKEKEYARARLANPRQHGTYVMYRHGKCRCELCKAANRETQRSYRERNLDMIRNRRREKYNLEKEKRCDSRHHLGA